MTPSPSPNAPEPSRLNRLHQLLGSDVFDSARPDDGTREPAFVNVIQLLDDLLQQSDAAGHRIDFTKEVGVHGKIQDVTSLVAGLRRSQIADSNGTAQYAPGQFNCYAGAGTGYFANGAFFDADHDDDVAFFVGDQRIYLNRHIRRATQEAEHYLTSQQPPA